ncbi:MAG TPA: hypothetical protein VEJ19_07955 [Nitrososphaerales archaeon]|nr:hypothetical protein [Nitrososphaerales archaeon]
MTVDKGAKKPYSYTFRTPQKDLVPGANPEALFSIRDTLLLLTEDCLVVERPEGLFCEKHSLPVMKGATRCKYLASRFANNEGEQQAKAQVQQYVNEILGVKDPKTVKRLTGF